MQGYRISTDRSLLDLELIHAWLSRMFLGTRDSHGLYGRYGGFMPLSAPERWMERVREKA
jgi:hypothetical protein